MREKNTNGENVINRKNRAIVSGCSASCEKTHIGCRGNKRRDFDKRINWSMVRVSWCDKGKKNGHGSVAMRQEEKKGKERKEKNSNKKPNQRSHARSQKKTKTQDKQEKENLAYHCRRPWSS